jgi:hypothetical protein
LCRDYPSESVQVLPRRLDSISPLTRFSDVRCSFLLVKVLRFTPPTLFLPIISRFLDKPDLLQFKFRSTSPTSGSTYLTMAFPSVDFPISATYLSSRLGLTLFIVHLPCYCASPPASILLDVCFCQLCHGSCCMTVSSFLTNAASFRPCSPLVKSDIVIQL